MSGPKLVIGANGFLGSHVTRQLVAAGHDVRAMVREGANTIGIDDLNTQRFVGDIWDNDTVAEAMTGCEDVYYCVVDTRGYLSDPLYRTNVDGTTAAMSSTSPRPCTARTRCGALSSPVPTLPSIAAAAV